MILNCDVFSGLKILSDQGEKFQCCVTSPPYWRLRDYDVTGQLGLEDTPEQYVENMVRVFRAIRNVLHDNGTLWLNIGDKYVSGSSGQNGTGKSTLHGNVRRSFRYDKISYVHKDKKCIGLKTKDLVGIPWMLAFALRADGWYLRSDIIWFKPNAMPESVTDRPTKAHEYIFLLSKSERYFYDADAIKEKGVSIGTELLDEKNRNTDLRRTGEIHGKESHVSGTRTSKNLSEAYKNVNWSVIGKNKRSVWTISAQPYSEAHFAVMPEALVEPCILAGSKVGDQVIDPFLGSGTVGLVAERLGRKWVGIELNPEYVKIAKRRTSQIGIIL